MLHHVGHASSVTWHLDLWHRSSILSAVILAQVNELGISPCKQVIGREMRPVTAVAFVEGERDFLGHKVEHYILSTRQV